ncbi:MAG: metallophosphoesterase [Clostridia bacterium]|nr:metallophosphoesterase [Clostridia bacterium]
MTYTCYSTAMKGLARPVRVAVVADLHNGAYSDVLRICKDLQAELILVPGDFVNSPTQTANGFAFLEEAAKLAPTFCSVGNHEVSCGIADLAAVVAKTGARLLDNECAFSHGIWIGGLSSGYTRGMQQGRTKPTPPPDRRFLATFTGIEGCRLLLCHHPEYYEPYLRNTDIPLIVAGHAHGGQWELFGHAIFAPGQGLFPRYTAGFYEERMVVSRGASNPHPIIPRICNPCEVVLIDIWPK